MEFLKKIVNAMADGLSWLGRRKAWLLILIPVIAAIVLVIVLVSGRGNDDIQPKDDTSAQSSDTTAVSTLTPNSGENLSGTLSNSSAPTSDTVETTPPPEPELPLELERTDVLSISETTEDGILLVTGEIEVPVFSNSTGSAVISAVNANVAAHCEEMRDAAVKKLRTFAQGELSGESPQLPFSYNAKTEITLSSDTAVSVLFSINVFSGGDKSAVYRSAVTCSLSDGSVFSLDSFFGSSVSDASEYIGGRITSEIAADSGDFYPDYEGLVEFYGLENRWYLSDSGFTVFYIPYEIAGYAKGILTYTIPYGDLNGYLTFNPAYTSSAQ
ncbi:MAG: RsiV family protein [Eubacteriales bacterium]